MFHVMSDAIEYQYRKEKIVKIMKKEGTDMSERQKKTETFIIKIMNQQNSTWQGSVTWVDEQREQYFRSALELLKLIDGALVTKNDSEDTCSDKR